MMGGVCMSDKVYIQMVYGYNRVKRYPFISDYEDLRNYAFFLCPPNLLHCEHTSYIGSFGLTVYQEGAHYYLKRASTSYIEEVARLYYNTVYLNRDASAPVDIMRVDKLGRVRRSVRKIAERVAEKAKTVQDVKDTAYLLFSGDTRYSLCLGVPEDRFFLRETVDFNLLHRSNPNRLKNKKRWKRF